MEEHNGIIGKHARIIRGCGNHVPHDRGANDGAHRLGYFTLWIGRSCFGVWPLTPRKPSTSPHRVRFASARSQAKPSPIFAHLSDYVYVVALVI